MDGKALQPIFSIEADPVGLGFRTAVEWPDGSIGHVMGRGSEEQACRWIENDAPNWIAHPDRRTTPK